MHTININSQTYRNGTILTLVGDDGCETTWRLPKRPARVSFYGNRRNGTAQLSVSNGTRVRFIVHGPVATVRALYDEMCKP